MLPERRLGKTGIEVTQLGLGGEGVLRTFGQEAAARAVIEGALNAGIRYCESARAYSGSEAYYGATLGARRQELFLASKSHERTAAGARAHLTTTLRICAPTGSISGRCMTCATKAIWPKSSVPAVPSRPLTAAKREGLVRFIGITGHQDPQILLKAFDLYDFDTVLLPVNPAEPAALSFLDSVLPEALARNMGIIGMKVLCRGFGLQVPGCASPAPWIRYALARGVSTIVIGCDDPAQVAENAAAAAMEPMTAAEMRELEQKVAPYARQLMYYK